MKGILYKYGEMARAYWLKGRMKHLGRKEDQGRGNAWCFQAHFDPFTEIETMFC